MTFNLVENHFVEKVLGLMRRLVDATFGRLRHLVLNSSIYVEINRILAENALVLNSFLFTRFYHNGWEIIL